MRETLEKEIDGLKISVVQFPGRAGFKLQAKLARIFGPVIGEILSGVKMADAKSVSKADMDLSKIPIALQKLFDSLGDEQALNLVLELLQFTKIDGMDVNDSVFDTKFQGNYAALYKILWLVLQHNFFGKGDIGTMLKRAMTYMAPVSPVN